MKLILPLLFGTLVMSTAKLAWDFQPSLAQQNCDRSYPDFCIPSPPPDKDCKDIGRSNFTVLSPDPHRFDGDRDGIGCER